MASRHVALRYMSGFRCLGPACEDHCCGGWDLPLDRVHHDKLQARLAGLGEDARFAEAIGPPPGARSDAMFAVLNRRDDGNCQFLTADRACEIHARHGEDHLGDICASYPRLVSRVGARLELAGALSCPEVARRALLADDATDVVPCEPAMIGRGKLAQRIDAEPAQPYFAALDPIRMTIFGLLGQRAYSMRSRLFFVTVFAERLGAFLVRDSAALDRARLLGEIETFGAAETLARLDASVREDDSSGEVATALALGLVIQVISTRLDRPASRKFRELYVTLMHGLAAAGAGVAVDDGDPSSGAVSAVELARYLGARRDAREALLGDRLDLYLENYCRSWVMSDWYLTAPSVAVHVQRMLVQVAMARLLLVHHPGLAAAAAQGVEAIDRLAIEVFYSQARTLEHGDLDVSELVAAMVGDAPTLAVAVALLQI